MSNRRKSSTTSHSSQNINPQSQPERPSAAAALSTHTNQPVTQRISTKKLSGTSLQPGSVRIATRSPYVSEDTPSQPRRQSSTISSDSNNSSFYSELSLPVTYTELYPQQQQTSNVMTRQSKNGPGFTKAAPLILPLPSNSSFGRVSRNDVHRSSTSTDKNNTKTNSNANTILSTSLNTKPSLPPSHVHPPIDQLSSTNMMHYTTLSMKADKKKNSSTSFYNNSIIPEEEGTYYSQDEEEEEYDKENASFEEPTLNTNSDYDDDNDNTDHGDDSEVTDNEFTHDFLTRKPSISKPSLQTIVYNNNNNNNNNSKNNNHGNTTNNDKNKNDNNNHNDTNRNCTKVSTTSSTSSTSSTSLNKNQNPRTNDLKNDLISTNNNTMTSHRLGGGSSTSLQSASSQVSTKSVKSIATSSTSKSSLNSSSASINNTPASSSSSSSPLQALPLIDPPYCRETYQQLINTQTVPKEIYHEYLAEVRKPPQSRQSSVSKNSMNKKNQGIEVPKEVERWTVKLPTRLEFKDITIRVLKKFPIKQHTFEQTSALPGSAITGEEHKLSPQLAELRLKNDQELARNNQIEAKLAKTHQNGRTSHHQIQSGQQKENSRVSRGQYEPSTSRQSAPSLSHISQDEIDEGYEFDLEKSPSCHHDDAIPHIPFGTTTTSNMSINNTNNNMKNNTNKNNQPNSMKNSINSEDEQGELFSPSTFRKKQQQQHGGNDQEYSRSNSNYESSVSVSKSSIRSSIRPGLFDNESDDSDDDFDSSSGLLSSLPCLSSQKFENRPVTILDSLHGVIEPGSMVAIMGSSGAGKTTLLNALSGRVNLADPALSDTQTILSLNTQAINAGSICLNGTRVTKNELASMCGYVLQNDVFLGTLTPRETLQFAAKLQLPQGISDERKLKRVERVIQQLDLSHIADTPIGGMFSKGISGGQKRRVSVGIELIKDPSVIYLDEPTSGLDSNTAVNVMKVLKHLSQTGRTVIFTIHSPNSKILEMFDTLILLSRGKLAYFGPAKKCLPYFSSFGYDCPLYSNQAEFFLNVLTPHSLAMYHSLLSNTHHTPEEMITPMDPRFKSILLLRAQLGLHRTRSNRAVPVQNMHGIGTHGGFINYSTQNEPKNDTTGTTSTTSTTSNASQSSTSTYIDPKLVYINRINGIVPVYTIIGGIHWVNVTTGVVHGDLQGKKGFALDKIHIDWSDVDWTLNYMGYSQSLLGDTTRQDDNWCVYVNGVKQETLRQKRRRVLIEQQYNLYQLYDHYCEENHPHAIFEQMIPYPSAQQGTASQVQLQLRSSATTTGGSRNSFTTSIPPSEHSILAPSVHKSVLSNMIATGFYQRELKNNPTLAASSQFSFPSSLYNSTSNLNETVANVQSVTKLQIAKMNSNQDSSTNIINTTTSTTELPINQIVGSIPSLSTTTLLNQNSRTTLQTGYTASTNLTQQSILNFNASQGSVCESFFTKHHHDHDFYFVNQHYHINPITNGSRVWNYALFPQSSHIYQQFFAPPPDSQQKKNSRQTTILPPPPPNPSAMSSLHYKSLIAYPPSQLFDINKVILAREDNRLTMITDAYLRHPIQPNYQYTPFLTDYVPKLRNLDKSGAASLAEIGFDLPSTSNSSSNFNHGNKRQDKQQEKKQIERMGLLQPGKAPLPWSKQFVVLTHRTFLHTMRDPLNTFARLAVNLLLTIFVGLLFFQTGNEQSSLYARVGFLFFMTSIQAFITVMGAVLTFSEERALFIREYQKQIYATSSYFLGRAVIDAILQTVLAIVFASLAYPMVGLQASFSKFIQYTICLVMVAQGSHSYALILGALIPYRTVALMLSPVIMVPFLTVSGFLCPLSKLSPTISWLTWLSPQRWMFDAMMHIEFTGLKFTCAPHEFVTIPLDNGTMEKVCPVIAGEEVLGLFGLSQDSNTFVYNLIACALIAVIMKFVALLSLEFSAWNHTRTSTGA